MTHMMTEILEQPKVLENCLSNNEEALEKIVLELRKDKPNYIIIAARGTSDHAAVYAKYMFETLAGIPVVLAAPSVLTTYKRKLIMKNALVIGVSQSGAAEDVCAVLKEANKENVTTVAITNFEDSLLAKTAKHVLLCSAGLEKSVAATKTFTTQLLLLGMLAAKLSENKEAETLLRKAPLYVDKTINEVKGQIENIAPKYVDDEDCVVLARGLNYSVALESALKIEETSYIRAKAFAASDFHHGPKAILKKDLPVIVYAPTGPSFENMVEIIDLLREEDTDNLIISDDESLRRAGESFIKIPKPESDLISPFENAVVAQLLACEISNNKGLNPDVPRMLKKVTVTV